MRRTKVALKGPLETPVGYGEKSANVTLRKFFETYGNIRPVRELPGIRTPYSGRGIDFIVVRENVEDLYAGIEHEVASGERGTQRDERPRPAPRHRQIGRVSSGDFAGTRERVGDPAARCG